MLFSTETFRRAAEDSGFSQASLERVVHLGQLLLQLETDPFLFDRLALKGGTAIHLMSDRPKRLSVDLDFNYVGAVDRTKMLVERPEVSLHLQTLAQVLGYTFRSGRDDHGGATYYLGYRNSLGMPDSVSLDVNYLNRVPLAPPQRVKLWQPNGFERPTALLNSTLEVVAGKIRAALDRVAARDVFDCMHLPSLFDSKWPPAELRTLFVFHCATLHAPLTSYGVDRLDKVAQTEIVNSLMPMLLRTESIDREALIEHAKEVCVPMLQLTEPEKEFTLRVQEGDLRIDLLYPGDDERIETLSKHPALIWKVQHAQAHAARGKK